MKKALLVVCLMLLAASPVQAQVQLSVNASNNIHTFSNEMLGIAAVSWEHAWGKPFLNQVPGLAQAVKAANIGLIRYAGGLWANWVGWERTNQRTPYTDWNPNPNNFSQQYRNQINTNNLYSFHYGQNEMDDLGNFSKSTGAEIMIQTDIAISDPYMWADLVQYANSERTHNFKYWELGNEDDLQYWFDEGVVDPSTYEARVESYLEVMKQANSNVPIKIIGGVPAFANDRGSDNNGISDWIDAAMRAVSPSGYRVDSLSYHHYGFDSCVYTNSGCVDNIPPTLADIFDYPGRLFAQDFPQHLQNTYPSVSHGVTELNMDCCDRRQDSRIQQDSHHATAVWMADMIGRLAYNGTEYLTWYDGFGEDFDGFATMSWNTSGDGILLRPTYYTLFMYGNFFGDQLIQSSSNNDAALSVWASTDSTDPGSLKLMVINTTGTSQTATIGLQGFSANSGAYYEMSSTRPTDLGPSSNVGAAWTSINGIQLNPMNVAGTVIPARTIDVTNNQSISKQFPAYSVTAIVLESTSPPPSGSPLAGDMDGDDDVDYADYTWVFERLFSGASIFDLARVIANFGDSQ